MILRALPAVAAILGTAAWAQVPLAPPGEEIVVVGRGAAARSEAARLFVRAISPLPTDGQFARWHAPFCPVVRGLPPELAARVTARLRTAARDARAPLGKEGCRTNAVVSFTDDAHGLLAAMERRDPKLLADVPLRDRRALRESRAPVLWWGSTLAVGADGNPLQSTPPVALGPLGAASGLPAGDRVRYGDSYRPSLISTSLRVGIDGAVVLIDVNRSTGRRLDAVADYAAFVLLARVRPTPPSSATPTILRLFEEPADTAPPALTAADRGYLAALYAEAPDRPAAVQARGIARRIAVGLPQPE